MDAFLVHLVDRGHQKHIQRNPLLVGQLPLSKELREAWFAHFEIRKPLGTPFSQESIDVQLDKLVSPQDRAAIIETCALIGLDETAADSIINTWGWKIARAPRGARRILAIGCSVGNEFVVLRALFPNAELNGVDYDVAIPTQWRRALRLGDLQEQHLEEYLAAHRESFDLVFSNHTLEHVSTPNETLRLVREALVSGGICVSALPLEGDISNPFYDDLLSIAEGRRKFDPQLDIEFISPSHAWKTNREDLASTLRAAGFSDIHILTRVNYPTSGQALHVSTFHRRQVLGGFLERTTLRYLRRGLRWMYPGDLPYPATKIYYAIASRCWFSRMRMVHHLTHEVVFTAIAGQEPP